MFNFCLRFYKHESPLNTGGITRIDSKLDLNMCYAA